MKNVELKIKNIAEKLNYISMTESYVFGRIQQIRKKKGHVASKKPFSRKGMKKNYAFHNGGIHEFQFNFGEEKINGKEYFRYGIALNLRRGQSLHDPIEEFKEKIKRYNQFYRKNKKFFDNISMWYYDKDKVRHILNKPAHLLKKLAIEGNFVFWGKIIRKTLSNVNKNDIKEILRLYDYLMPLYEFIENGKVFSKPEEKIARICWNTNGWETPSGKTGKSNNKSHEKKFGFGYEEWLFDRGKTYEGYIYGFVEPIYKSYYKYIGKVFNLSLYTIDGSDKTKYWVGKLNNVEVIDEEMQGKVYNYYLKKRWLNDMISDLQQVDLQTKRIEKIWNINGLYPNVRFRPNELKGILNEPEKIINPDKFINSTRYVLLNINENIDFENTEKKDTGFNPKSGTSKPTKGQNNKGYRTVHKKIELKGKHLDILNGMLVYLQKKYKGQEVRKESSVNNCQIDLYRKDRKGYIFYEVKSYDDLFTSLRVALGQLLEYNCYPDKKYAYKMYLVSDLEPNGKFIKYINHLKKIISVPLGYIQFDTDKQEIITTI